MSRSYGRADGRVFTAGLLTPAAAVILFLLVAPLVTLAWLSLTPVVDGQETAGTTLGNYAAFLGPAYAFYFYDTIRLAALAAALAVILGAPLAFICARTRRPWLRRLILLLLVGVLFMSVVARLYALEVSFARTGPLAWMVPLLGLRSGSPGFAVMTVVMGLLHFVLPPVALMLVGTFQNLDPRLEEAAAVLGASRPRAVLDIVLPAALPGLVAALTLAFAMGVSNFVIPLVLGRGVVSFVSNLIYVRVSQFADYPSAAALAVMMLAAISLLVWGFGRLLGRTVPLA